MTNFVRTRLHRWHYLAFAAGFGLMLMAVRMAADVPLAQDNRPQDNKSRPTQAARTPLVRVVDLDVGESQVVTLCNGKQVSVKLTGLKELRDPVRSAVRRAEVRVEVDGRAAQLVVANYNVPLRLGDVQID